MSSRALTLPAWEDISTASRYYWGYQYELGRRVLVPELQRRGIFHPGDAVAEIGCAEGGVLMSFVEAGATSALGTDIAPSRLESARRIADRLGLQITFAVHDILADPIPESWRGRYHVVLLRDVLEHLDSPETALRRIAQLLRPGGYLYISFPPYPSPYGGHQHLLHNLWGKLPYVHLLPEPVFERLIASGREPDRSEVRRLRRIRLSFGRFHRAVAESGYRIVLQKHYLLRPVFRFRFGLPLPAIELTPLARLLPEVFQFLCMEASYVLQCCAECSS